MWKVYIVLPNNSIKVCGLVKFQIDSASQLKKCLNPFQNIKWFCFTTREMIPDLLLLSVVVLLTCVNPYVWMSFEPYSKKLDLRIHSSKTNMSSLFLRFNTIKEIKIIQVNPSSKIAANVWKKTVLPMCKCGV